VVYEKFEDADKAILEYHGAQLDDKILTVEHDLSSVLRIPKVQAADQASKRGKTLRLGGGRAAADRR